MVPEGDPAPTGDPAPKTYTEADLQGLKSKNAELLGKLGPLQDATKQLLGDRKLEDVLADITLAKETREKKAKAEGDFTTLKDQLVEQHKGELGKKDTRITKVEGKLFDVLARREAEREIREAGGDPKLLLPHVLPSIKVTEKDDDFVAVVVDAKGNPRISDGQGTAMSIKQLVESFKADDSLGKAFAPSGAAGSGSRNGGGGGGGATGAVIIPRNATPQEYKRLKEQAEKDGRPYQVAAA